MGNSATKAPQLNTLKGFCFAEFNGVNEDTKFLHKTIGKMVKGKIEKMRRLEDKAKGWMALLNFPRGPLFNWLKMIRMDR